jgi:hypothetical protein
MNTANFRTPDVATPYDIALTAAIIRSADVLRFDNRPGSIERQRTLGLFVAALSDRLELAFPEAAAALHELVFSPATSSNPICTGTNRSE